MLRLVVRSAVLVWVALFAACKADLSIPKNARLSCLTDSECPSGYICVGGERCVKASADAAKTPDIDGPITITPADRPGKAQTTFGIDFAVTKPLQQLPDVSLELTPAPKADCSSAGGLQYHCTYTATGQENGGTGGNIPFDVNLIDTDGLPGQHLAAGVLPMDFTPPKVLDGTTSLQLIPGGDNPLTVVQTATVGTTIRLIFAATEALGQDPVVTLASNPSVQFSQTVAAGTTYVYEATLTSAAGITDGKQVVQVALQDLAGNPNTVLLKVPGLGLVIRTMAPSLSVDQSQVLFVRSPWGSQSGESVGSTMVQGPYFVLGPAQGTLAGASLPASTFSFGSLTPQLIRVWADEDKGALLGRLMPNADGTWPLTLLAQVDVPTVYVSGLDDAGNESALVKIQNAEWVATTAPSVAGTPQVESLPAAGPARISPWTTIRSDGSLASGSTGMPVSSQVDAVWRDISSNPGPSVANGVTALQAAYDSDHGRVLALASSTNQVWAWDGYRWTPQVPVGEVPPISSAPVWVYDNARGRALLWDAPGSRLSEWDGVGWTSVPMNGGVPPPYATGPAAFDAHRQRLVVFVSTSGGDPSSPLEIWEWDGAAWTRPTPSASQPDARSDFSVAYDPDLGGVVLFGGTSSTGGFLSSLWLWDGSSWRQLPAGAIVPPERSLAGLAYDVGRHRLVMSGGSSSQLTLSDTWEWDGTQWHQAGLVGVPNTNGFSSVLVYDETRQRTLLTDLISPATWEWDGSAWINRTGAITPGQRSDVSLAYDSARKKSVLVGTFSTSQSRLAAPVYEWDGSAWSVTQPAVGPPLLKSPSSAFFPPLGMTVVFGGYDGLGLTNNLWGWNGLAWTLLTLPVLSNPGAREGASFVYDETRKKMVLVGGTALDTTTHMTVTENDLWEWDGAHWTNPMPAQLPQLSLSLQNGLTAAYDSARQQTVLFGFPTGNASSAWGWNGMNWSALGSGGQPFPVVREGARSVWDPVRQEILLFGGTSADSRLWAWDGQQWHDVTPVGNGPSPRAAFGMAFDTDKKQLLVYGGSNEMNAPLSDFWLIDEAQPQRPAVQFTADASRAGFDPQALTGLHVRALCGGQAPSGSGAELQGWAVGESGQPASGWETLDMNMQAPSATMPAWLEKEITSGDEARRFLLGADRALAFRCVSAGDSPVGANAATVALQFAEVHVRYQVQ